MKDEIWKEIKDYEGLYMVSSYGAVKSMERRPPRKNGSVGYYKARTLKLGNTHKGYLNVGLCKNNKCKSIVVHRLVAMAFIPKVENKNQVNHIDGNKHNNHVSNLEWLNCKENIRHYWETSKDKSFRTSTTSAEVIEIFQKLKDPRQRYQVIADQYGLSYQAVAHMAGGRSWQKERAIAEYVPFKRKSRLKNSEKLLNAESKESK